MVSRKALIPFRDQRKPICEVAVAAFHELPLSRPAATLSPPCGERAGRGVPIWFMVPMHAEKRKEALHEPAPSPLPSPPPRGRGCPKGGGGGRFIAPMRDSEIAVAS